MSTPRKPRSANREKHAIMAEKFGKLNLDDINAFVKEMVSSRPATSRYLLDQLQESVDSVTTVD